MKYVYRLKNCIVNSYSDPIFDFANPDTKFKQLHDFIILYPDKAHEQFLDSSIVECFATYDESVGQIVLLGEVKSYNLKESYDQLQALKVQANA